MIGAGADFFVEPPNFIFCVGRCIEARCGPRNDARGARRCGRSRVVCAARSSSHAARLSSSRDLRGDLVAAAPNHSSMLPLLPLFLGATLEAQKAGLVDCCVGVDPATSKRSCRIVTEKQNFCSFARNVTACHNAKTSSRPCVWDAGKCIKGYLYGTIGHQPVCPDPPLFHEKKVSKPSADSPIARGSDSSSGIMTAAVAAAAKQPAGGGVATSTGKEQEREARIKERQALREVTPKNQPKPHTAQVQPSQQLQTTQLEPAQSQSTRSQSMQLDSIPVQPTQPQQPPEVPPLHPQPSKSLSSLAARQAARPQDYADSYPLALEQKAASDTPKSEGTVSLQRPSTGRDQQKATSGVGGVGGGGVGGGVGRRPLDDSRRPMTPADVVKRLTPMFPTLLNATSTAKMSAIEVLETLKPVVDNATATFLRDRLPVWKEKARGHAHRFHDHVATEVFPWANRTAHTVRGFVVRKILSQGLSPAVAQRIGLPEAHYVGDIPVAAWARIGAQPLGNRAGIYLILALISGGTVYLLLRCILRCVRCCLGRLCCCCGANGCCGCLVRALCCGRCSRLTDERSLRYRRLRDRHEREALANGSLSSRSETDEERGEASRQGSRSMYL